MVLGDVVTTLETFGDGALNGTNNKIAEGFEKSAGAISKFEEVSGKALGRVAAFNSLLALTGTDLNKIAFNLGLTSEENIREAETTAGAIAGELSAIGSAIAGFELGGRVGSAFGPIGSAIGAAVGTVAGSLAGSFLREQSQKLFDELFGEVGQRAAEEDPEAQRQARLRRGETVNIIEEDDNINENFSKLIQTDEDQRAEIERRTEEIRRRNNFASSFSPIGGGAFSALPPQRIDTLEKRINEAIEDVNTQREAARIIQRQQAELLKSLSAQNRD